MQQNTPFRDEKKTEKSKSSPFSDPSRMRRGYPSPHRPLGTVSWLLSPLLTCLTSLTLRPTLLYGIV